MEIILHPTETVCIIFLLWTKKHTGHTRHCFHHNPRLVVLFWGSLAFCTSALCRIWRASRLVAHWACGRLWSWKVLNDDVSNTWTRSKKMNQWVIRNWKDEVDWNWELLKLDRLSACSFSCRLKNKSQFAKTKQNLLEHLPLLSLSHLSNLNMSQVSFHHVHSCLLVTICVQSILRTSNQDLHALSTECMMMSPAFHKARHLARLVKDFHTAWASWAHDSKNFNHVWLSIVKPLQPHFTNMQGEKNRSKHHQTESRDHMGYSICVQNVQLEENTTTPSTQWLVLYRLQYIISM